MSALNIGGVESYTIPLDSLDLTYLSKYVRSPNAEKRPLWTKRCLDGESEYCHVHIVTHDDSGDCYSEPSDTYKCHICNVQVPIMFYKKHTESEQHETIKNISQKVLERVSKQINLSVINIDKDIDKDMYYCVPCSKIIKIENKLKHETSDYHIKSKKHICIVSDFYKIFKENKSSDDKVVFNEEHDEESDTQPDWFKFYKAKTNNLSNSLDSDDDSVDQSPVTDNLTVTPTTSNTANIIQPTKDEKTESFEEYLKEMIKKYKLKVNVPVINGVYISIVAPNGHTVKVSREHFQSYLQLKNSVYCQLCEICISQDTKSHDVTENHVRNILKPINEKFARTMDTVSSHCVPCNKVVLTNSNHHTLNDNHKKIIKDTHTPKAGKTFCADCNIYIDTHNYKIHIKSKKHITVLMEQNSVLKTGNDNIFVCKICNRIVSKYDFKSHVNSKTHIAKKNHDSAEINNINNGSTKVNNTNNDSPAVSIKINDSLYCEVCKVKVPGGGMKIHVNGKPHKEMVSRLCSENKNVIKPKDNKFQSGEKPGSVAQNGSSVSRNTKSQLPKSNFARTNSMSSTDSSLSNSINLLNDKIDAYYGLLEFTDDTKGEARCKICFVNVVFVVRNIIEHMEGKSHIEIANKKKMEVFTKLLFYTDDAKTKVKCEICDVNIPHVERNIIEHMEGRNHEVAENELLVFHSVTRDSSGYFCECCEEHTTDYFEHINSKAHTNKFLENYVIDKNAMRKYVYEDVENDYVGRRHRERYRNLLRHNYIYRMNNTNYFCNVCQTKLGRITEINHVLGERHALKLREFNKLLG